MSGYCPTGCVCRSAAGSANPRVVPDATATAQHDTPIPVAVQECQPVRVSSCRQCGDNPHAVLNAFKEGVRCGIFESYRENLEATQRREAAQRLHETAPVERWHE